MILRNPKYITPERLHPIKKEGIGIVEMAGCGIYPVPKGEHSSALWQTIEQEGDAVIHDIIANNSPINRADYDVLWQAILTTLTQANTSPFSPNKNLKSSLLRALI